MAAAASILGLGFLPALAGQERPTIPPGGQVFEEVSTAADAEQRYALFLPGGFDPDRPTPVLFVLDPRGRAMPGLELFRAGAERNGYAILSSFNSRSDTAMSVTVDAFVALLDEAQTRFRIAPRRTVIAGMSGTSRAAFALALELGDHVLGVIGVGGALPSTMDDPPDDLRFAYFGIAGYSDFNYQEHRELDRALEGGGHRHRLEHFDGYHGWPSDPELTGLALDWMHLVAMERELAPPDADAIDRFVARDLVRLESAPDALERHRRTVNLQADAGLLPADRRAALPDPRADDEVQRLDRLASRLARREASYLTSIAPPVWARIQNGGAPLPPLARALAELQIERLREQSASGGFRESRSARRLLGSLFATASFYLPNRLAQAGRPEAARLCREIAAAIRSPPPGAGP